MEYKAKCEECMPFLTIAIDPPQNLLQDNTISFLVETPVKAYAMRFRIDKQFENGNMMHYFSRVLLECGDKVLFDDKLDNDFEKEPLVGFINVKCVFDKDGVFGKELSGQVRITLFPNEAINFQRLQLSRVVFDVDDYRFYYQSQRQDQRGEILRDTIASLRRKIQQHSDKHEKQVLIIIILSVICVLLAISLLTALMWPSRSLKMKHPVVPV